VERNLAEAYRWFSIAANAGDTAAREKQLQVEGLLKASERSALDKAAAGFLRDREAARP
jgi:TPR repeat protein